MEFFALVGMVFLFLICWRAVSILLVLERIRKEVGEDQKVRTFGLEWDTFTFVFWVLVPMALGAPLAFYAEGLSFFLPMGEEDIAQLKEDMVEELVEDF